jgi:hypothetical protein
VEYEKINSLGPEEVNRLLEEVSLEYDKFNGIGNDLIPFFNEVMSLKESVYEKVNESRSLKKELQLIKEWQDNGIAPGDVLYSLGGTTPTHYQNLATSTKEQFETGYLSTIDRVLVGSYSPLEPHRSAPNYGKYLGVTRVYRKNRNGDWGKTINKLNRFEASYFVKILKEYPSGFVGSDDFVHSAVCANGERIYIYKGYFVAKLEKRKGKIDRILGQMYKDKGSSWVDYIPEDDNIKFYKSNILDLEYAEAILKIIDEPSNAVLYASDKNNPICKIATEVLERGLREY